MTPALIVLAVLVTAGGVAAVSAREPRLAALGLFVALVGSTYIADPLPDLVALGARLVGAVLGGYLVWIALRGPAAPTMGWQIGWPGAAAIGAAAFTAGWLAANSLGTALAAGGGEGPSAAGVATALAGGSLVPRAGIAAAIALAALGAAPVALARDALRSGIGLMLLVAASALVRNALAPDVDEILELGMAVLTALAGAAAAGLVAASIRTQGDLNLRAGGRVAVVRHRSADEAHPGRRPVDGNP